MLLKMLIHKFALSPSPSFLFRILFFFARPLPLSHPSFPLGFLEEFMSALSRSGNNALAVQKRQQNLGPLSDKGQPLPKFGEWDVNDPASAEGFTVIFNKARDEKKTGGSARGPDSPGKEETAFKHGPYAPKPNVNAKKWFCCIQSSSAES
ncbi:protein NOI4 isoform X2 [Elaeis guineensis]|uniref:protein NOI4 isoform X2 n=1 Tax=Elaeis guineensis var. tenera TaxID=51953 RepID=UPI003C6CFB6F